MKIPVYNNQGQTTGNEVELDSEVFEIEPNEHVMYLAVKVQRARMRQGTHSAKSRSMVQGGGKKPWRQKGRGTARVGTTRSPVWRHGGVTFGPLPHVYNMRLPIKVNRLARKSAFSVRRKENAIKVVEDFLFDKACTRDLAEILKALELTGKKVLILTGKYDGNLVKSARNLQRCDIQVGIDASTMDLLNHNVLLIIQGALKPISEVLGGRKRTAEEAA